jgi:CRP/FNR family transcriptional regulator, cyclic AMP receptor protein
MNTNELHVPPADSVRAPYGLEIIESCIACPHREERLFCNLSPRAVQMLSAITSATTYPRGATLFIEGQASRGVFILCSGRVKLSTSSADGKTLIARISEPGEVLGLPAAVSGKPYELTAEVIEPAQANFIPRTNFLKFLCENGEAALHVAQQLGETYHTAISEMRMIGLSHSAAEKLVQFLVDQSTEHAQGKDQVKFALVFTHEEIGQMIGTTRETVSRAFADLKKKQLIQVKGSALTIPSRAALQKLIRS